jgi:hypothetical protein
LLNDEVTDLSCYLHNHLASWIRGSQIDIVSPLFRALLVSFQLILFIRRFWYRPYPLNFNFRRSVIPDFLQMDRTAALSIQYPRSSEAVFSRLGCVFFLVISSHCFYFHLFWSSLHSLYLSFLDVCTAIMKDTAVKWVLNSSLGMAGACTARHEEAGADYLGGI